MKSLPAIIICLVCIVHLIEPQDSSGSSSGPSQLAVRMSELEAMVQTLQDQVNDIQSCCQPVFEQIGTSDQYDYKVIGREFITVPGDETFMLFQVEACNDAHILLMQSNSTTDDIYEIVIGGWNNTRSLIREERLGPNLATTFHENGPVHCELMRQFWVSWDQGVIRVGRGLKVDVNEFISLANATLTQVQHVALATGWRATGLWMIYDNACPCLK